MVAYEYRCLVHGVFVEDFGMGDAPVSVVCGTCGQGAGRFYSAPILQRANPDRMALIDRAEKSRDEPDVVSSLPPRHPSKRTPMAPPNPALQRLPRP